MYTRTIRFPTENCQPHKNSTVNMEITEQVRNFSSTTAQVTIRQGDLLTPILFNIALE